MNTREKPVHGRNREWAEVGTTAWRGTSISEVDSTTAAGGRQLGFVESILLREGARGASHALRTVELARLAGFSNARGLQAQIEAERTNGALICSRCSNGGGYYIPGSRAELVAFERTLRRRALGTLRTLKATRRALRVMEGQEVLHDE